MVPRRTLRSEQAIEVVFGARRQIAPIATVGKPTAIVSVAGRGCGANDNSGCNPSSQSSFVMMPRTMRTMRSMWSVTSARPSGFFDQDETAVANLRFPKH